MLLLDLDRFKAINDTLGHDAGDRLLQQTADRLRACVRGSDTLARLGGDEFVIIQMELGQKADAAALADRIKQAFEETFDLGGQSVHVGTSIGIAIAASERQEAESAGELLRRADLALYQAKLDTRGGHRFFEECMNVRIQRRKLLEHDLRLALSEQQLELRYQPQLDLRTGRMTGVEALLRWRHPERGWVPPTDFIPLAEESDLIVAIGEWVLGEACAQAANWPSLKEDAKGHHINSTIVFKSTISHVYIATSVRTIFCFAKQIRSTRWRRLSTDCQAPRRSCPIGCSQ